MAESSERRFGSRRIGWWAVGILGALSVVGAAWSNWRLSRDQDRPLGDLHVYIDAAKFVQRGGDLYDYRTAREALGFTYPPIAEVILSPLSRVSEILINPLWTLSTFVVVAFLAWLIVRYSRPNAMRSSENFVLIAFATFFLLETVQVQSNIVAGQISIFLIVAVVLDICGPWPRHLRGILVGAAAAIKLTPLIFIPYFIITKQWRAFANSVGAFAGLTVLGAILHPDWSATYWLSAIYDTSRIGETAFSGNQSARGMFARLGVTGLSQVILWLVVAGSATVAAYIQARRSAKRGDELSAICLLGCASVLLSPVSWPFHALWVPLIAIILVLRKTPISMVAGFGVAVVCVGWSQIVHLLGSNTIGGRIFIESITIISLAICVLGIGGFGQVKCDPGAPPESRRAPSGE